MKNSYRIAKAAREINPEVYEGQMVDTILNFVEGAGWEWVEPQVVNDPQGCPHYVPADEGFAEQVVSVYDLHNDLTKLGML